MKKLKNIINNIKNKRRESIKYTNTLNMPKTDFQIRSNVLTSEPLLQKICSEELYKIVQKRSDDKVFVLHDGPPYASNFFI
jgi:isoleucyl-tRNA synthetase